MTSPTSIRAFAPEDVDAVIDLLQDVSAFRPSADEVPGLALAFSSLSNCYACVATRGDRLLGFGSVFLLTRLRGGRSAIIEDVVVASDMRGHNVGRQIIDALLDFAKLQGCFKVSLEAAEPAEQFYRRVGFEPAGKVMKISLLSAKNDRD